MREKREQIAATVASLREAKPVLNELLDSFEPLWLARADACKALQARFGEDGVRLPHKSEELASKGISLLAKSDLSFLWPYVAQCARDFVPVYAAHPKLLPALPDVKDFFAKEQEKSFSRDFLKAILENDFAAAGFLAGLEGVAAGSLFFATEFALSCVLRAFTMQLEPSKDEQTNPWPLWSKGYCPVCGRLPTMDWFGKGYEDITNPFLITGAGRKYLHCGLCGSDWRFRRAMCPACGSDTKGCMSVMYDVKNQSEHVSCCSECKKYVVGLDLRSLSPIPDFDVMTFGMLPLDMRAAEEGFSPMCQTAWNCP